MTYQNYTKEIDYAEQIAKMMDRGAASYEVEDMLNRRVNKALDNAKERYDYLTRLTALYGQD